MEKIIKQIVTKAGIFNPTGTLKETGNIRKHKIVYEIRIKV